MSVSSFGPGFVPISNCVIEAGGSLSCTQITDASCDHSMDLGVVCNLIQHQSTTTNLIPNQSTTPNLQTSTSIATQPPSTSALMANSEAIQTTSSPISIPEASDSAIVLGTVIGVLVAVIVAMAIGWLCTCVILKRQSTVIMKNSR